MHSKKISGVLLFVTVFLTGGASVYGAPLAAEGKAAALAEVVVTATRNTEEIRNIPANVSVITAKQIEDSGATTIVDVLAKLGSVSFYDYSGASASAVIDMRGFGGDAPYGKTLIMLDGRRLNRSDMISINWLQIPLNNVERIEVVRGAGSVLYGDSAIGGVINVITKKGEGKPRFNASIIAGSYGLHDERVGVSGSADKWSYSLTGENNYNSGYRERSKSSSQGGGLALGYEASDKLDVSLGVSFNKTEYQLPGSLTKAQMEQDRRQYQPAGGPWAPAHSDDDNSDKFTNVDIGIRSFLGSWGNFELNFIYGKKELQINMPSWFVYSDTASDTYGVAPKYVLEKNIFGFDNKLVAGLDYYTESYKKDFFGNRERTAKSSWADFTKDSVGYYLRDEFSIFKNLILNAGYRFEQTTIKGSNNDNVTAANSFSGRERDYDAGVYEGGLTWLLGKQSKVFAKYSTIYRIPFLDEVAYFNGGGGGFLMNLEKEKGVSTEAGTEFYPLNNLKIGLTLFRIDMEDEIMYVGVFPTGKNENAGKTRHEGVEASFSYLWEKHARLYGNFTYHQATFENGVNNKKEIPMTPNRVANAGLEVFLPFNLTLRPEIRYVGEAFLGGDNDNNAEKLESCTLLDLYLFYRPSFKKVKMTAFLGAENLTDRKYSSYGYDGAPWGANTYYPMPGIVFKGGLSFEF